MSSNIQFKVPENVVFVRPGQIALIAVGDTTIEVRGIDHPPFRCEPGVLPSEKLADLHVVLRPGEGYATRREDGTKLTVSAVER